MENRISVKHKNPNPLFEKWLVEWREKAKEKNSKTQHAYSLALASLRKYPLPLESGKDCKLLKGFGNKLCDMLDEALKNHKGNSGECVAPKNKSPTPEITPEKSEESVGQDGKDYVPGYRSGAYAILVTLFKKSSEDNYKGFMLKKEIIKEAQSHCDTSFTKAQVGSFYTAWNSMATLINKKLVTKYSNPAKFSLTTKGVLLGCQLLNENEAGSQQVSSAIKEKCATKKLSEKACVVLSDSDDNNMDCFSNEKVLISDELKGICGEYNEEIEKAPSIPNMKNGEKICEISEFEDFIMEPFSFDVFLYIDTAETNGQMNDPKADAILSELKRLDVTYEVQNLKVGDYCWIFRHKKSGKELVAPYIVERKRMDDLAGSIKDGRFHEQKFRIKQCGLKNVIYMVESYGTKDQHVGLPLSSLNQAIVNTYIQDGFTVKIVEGVRGLAEYLSCMTNLIKKHFENKTLVSCPKENIADNSINDDLMSLMYFKEFNKFSTKTKSFTVKETFIRHLLQIKGLSIEKALAIVDEYPTPKLLKDMILENEKKSVNILSNMKYGKLGKKLGPLLAETVCMFYGKSSF